MIKRLTGEDQPPLLAAAGTASGDGHSWGSSGRGLQRLLGRVARFHGPLPWRGSFLGMPWMVMVAFLLWEWWGSLFTLLSWGKSHRTVGTQTSLGLMLNSPGEGPPQPWHIAPSLHHSSGSFYKKMRNAFCCLGNHTPLQSLTHDILH